MEIWQWFRKFMANYSSSESCNSAPEVIFNFNSFSPDGERVETPYGLCSLCLREKKCFYCRDCVRNGAFTHTKDKSLERFADKKLKAYKINEKREKLLQKYDKLLASKIKAENLKLEISQCTERNQLLKECIRQTNDEVQKSQKLVEHIQLKNERWRSTKPKFAKKIADMEKAEDRFRHHMIRSRMKLKELKLSLKGIIRKSIKQLVMHIFPIMEVKKSKHSENLCETQRTELQEAQQIMFVQDHWEFASDTEIDGLYSIVEPCLPADGDYSSYVYWTSKEHGTMPLTESGRYRRDLAFGISAALTYASQFVMVLSFYLDIHVPKRLCYSEFCGTELTEESFLHKVAKLNANVIHLCLSQNVEPSLIKPKRTIENLLLLLDTNVSDLGRIGPIEEKYKISRSAENILAKDLTFEEDDDRNCEEIEQDWVKVNEGYDIDYAAVYHPEVAAAAQPALVSHRAATLTGDWISSVASIWRAATGQKQ